MTWELNAPIRSRVRPLAYPHIADIARFVLLLLFSFLFSFSYLVLCGSLTDFNMGDQQTRKDVQTLPSICPFSMRAQSQLIYMHSSADFEIHKRYRFPRNVVALVAAERITCAMLHLYLLYPCHLLLSHKRVRLYLFHDGWMALFIDVPQPKCLPLPHFPVRTK